MSIKSLNHYIAMRDAQPLKQIGDNVHSIHAGTKYEAELMFSDIKNVSTSIAELSAQNEWLKTRIAELQLPATKRDYDTREKWLIQCGMPADKADAP